MNLGGTRGGLWIRIGGALFDLTQVRALFPAPNDAQRSVILLDGGRLEIEAPVHEVVAAITRTVRKISDGAPFPGLEEPASKPSP